MPTDCATIIELGLFFSTMNYQPGQLIPLLDPKNLLGSKKRKNYPGREIVQKHTLKKGFLSQRKNKLHFSIHYLSLYV